MLAWTILGHCSVSSTNEFPSRIAFWLVSANNDLEVMTCHCPFFVRRPVNSCRAEEFGPGRYGPINPKISALYKYFVPSYHNQIKKSIDYFKYYINLNKKFIYNYFSFNFQISFLHLQVWHKNFISYQHWPKHSYSVLLLRVMPVFGQMSAWRREIHLHVLEILNTLRKWQIFPKNNYLIFERILYAKLPFYHCVCVLGPRWHDPVYLFVVDFTINNFSSPSIKFARNYVLSLSNLGGQYWAAWFYFEKISKKEKRWKILGGKRFVRRSSWYFYTWTLNSTPTMNAFR